MGVWCAAIFGNDTACDVKEDFYEKYNGNEKIEHIKSYFLSDCDDNETFDMIFALAYCLWEVGALDNELLLKVKEIIISGKDLCCAKKLGADNKYLKQRKSITEKFLEKISTPKAKPKKRVALPKHIESKYLNGTVVTFQYKDLSYGALIVVNSQHYDKKTYYTFLQTDTKTKDKPTMATILKSHILDDCFHSYEYQKRIGRSKKYYYTFSNCISDLLLSRETKRFEKYNDAFFEIVGYLSEWKNCMGGTKGIGLSYNAKTYEDFCNQSQEALTNLYNTKLHIATKLTVNEIENEFAKREKIEIPEL